MSTKLGGLCPAPCCFPHARDFQIPRPGCTRDQLRFGHDGRDYFAVLLRNHDFGSAQRPNPRVAIVGLSPAGNQIEEFVQAYASTRDYGAASIAGAFAGLAKDIIGMIKGLGLAEKLNLQFENANLAQHPDVYVTSLVACASLGTDGSSDDFNPAQYAGARRCVSERFVREILNPAFSRLSHVLVLGSKSWSAVGNIQTSNNQSVLAALRVAGKVVLNLPHPSGQNQEYVKLASLTADQMPSLDQYVADRWREYVLKPSRPGRRKQSEAEYRAKRATVWRTVDQLRRYVVRLEGSHQ